MCTLSYHGTRSGSHLFPFPFAHFPPSPPSHLLLLGMMPQYSRAIHCAIHCPGSCSPSSLQVPRSPEMPAVFGVAASPSVGSLPGGHLVLRPASTVRVASASTSAVVSAPFRPVQTSSSGHVPLARSRSPPFALDRRSLLRTVESALRFGQRLGPDALAFAISAASVARQVRGLPGSYNLGGALSAPHPQV